MCSTTEMFATSRKRPSTALTSNDASDGYDAYHDASSTVIASTPTLPPEGTVHTYMDVVEHREATSNITAAHENVQSTHISAISEGNTYMMLDQRHPATQGNNPNPMPVYEVLQTDTNRV